MPIAIKVENLSKAYQLGEIGTGTISRDIERWYARIRGREDPFLRIGETNDIGTKGNQGTVWSLKDINFEVEKGDLIGIIGRNGAGKSTLLKVLSRITAPTTGRIRGNGRVASLLEVGTGFNPELTGRENTYLNGAILGMRKKEIDRHFDDIVDFAGIGRYIDTPVKRYSSGMYVRLAFAVAAHLESEILIVDEVLAVGDAEFQKKCLGKMSDISKGEGRTILFVSHNMGVVKELCSKGILLNQGKIQFQGSIDATISNYLKTGISNGTIDQKTVMGTLKNAIVFNQVTVNSIKDQEALFHPSSQLVIQASGICVKALPRFRTSFNIYHEGFLVCTLHDLKEPEPLAEGKFLAEVILPPFLLRPGEYTLALGGHNADNRSQGDEWVFAMDIFAFSIQQIWSDRNDYSAKGFINVPFAGKRQQS